MKKILGCIKRADQEHQMISAGDTLAVGLSGGKDSMVLLYALHLYQKFSPHPFQLKAITLDLGFEGFDLQTISDFCQNLGVEHVIEHSLIGRVIFDERKEKNPCSLCATMRRGRLNRMCKEMGATKLVFGHHGDDAIQTMLMSMIYESRIHTFRPVTYFERADLTMIRPLIYAMESDVISAAQNHSIPIVKNPCPASGNSKREYMKQLVHTLDQEILDSRKHLLACVWRSKAY